MPYVEWVHVDVHVQQQIHFVHLRPGLDSRDCKEHTERLACPQLVRRISLLDTMQCHQGHDTPLSNFLPSGSLSVISKMSVKSSVCWTTSAAILHGRRRSHEAVGGGGRDQQARGNTSETEHRVCGQSQWKCSLPCSSVHTQIAWQQQVTWCGPDYRARRGMDVGMMTE